MRTLPLALRTLTEIKGKRDPRYNGLIVYGLWRSASRPEKAGVREKVTMAISGHKTRSVFDHYHIVDTDEVLATMQRVQSKAGSSDSIVTNQLVLPSSNRR